MNDDWKPVLSIPDCYANTAGQIRHKGKLKPQCLAGKYYKIGRGYLVTRINGKLRPVHRLVAEAFIPNPDNLPEVNHKNGHTTDNWSSNLEWVTTSQNQLHALAHGRRRILQGQEVATATFTKEEIDECRRLLTSGCSHREVSRRTGISKTHIGRIQSGESRKIA